MTKIKGKYINLRESEDRRSQIEDQLAKLGVTKSYSRFEAVKGDINEASKRDLESGELGIWKSWIKLLKEEIKKNDDYDYLHILEDDCVLTKELCIVCNKLASLKNKYDFLATDMYVNPSIYKRLRRESKVNIEKNHIEILEGLYTGCLSSILIPKACIRKITDLLDEEYKKEKVIVPIDNFFVRLQNQGDIKTGVTLPFITTVREDSIINSTIQERTNEDQTIKKTQQLCYLLRKNLSTIDDSKYCLNMTKTAIELIGLNTKDSIDTESIVTNMILKALDGEHLKYKFRPNLIAEPENPQKRRLA